MSDCWRAYDCLSSDFVHQTVNHSVHFVDPDSGAHTQNIERLWRDVRGGIPRFGRSNKHISSAIWLNFFLNENSPTIAIEFTLSFGPSPNYIRRHASSPTLHTEVV